MLASLLICLLGSSPASADGANPGPDLHLPASASADRSPGEEITVQVSLDALKVDGRKILDLRRGVIDAKAKERGRADSFLVAPVFRALERAVAGRRAAARRDGGASDVGRLNVVVDPRVRYRTLMEVLFSAGQARLGSYGLVVRRQDGTLGVLEVTPPRLGVRGVATVGLLPPLEPAADEEPALLLTVAIGRDGFYVAGAGGVLQGDGVPTEGRRPPTISLADRKHDFAKLTAVLAEIKAHFPRETQVFLAADEDIPYETLIRTIDACREQVVTRPDGTIERRPLFPDVSLSLIG